MQIDYLAIVWRTLQKYRVPEYAYSLGSEDDEKVNLFYADGYWIVTNVERGTRCFEKRFEDVNAAVAQFFDELSVTEFRYKRMNRFFLKNVCWMESYKGMTRNEYYIPNVAALSGRNGRAIFETIKNSPAQDRTKLRKEVEELKAKILAARKDGK